MEREKVERERIHSINMEREKVERERERENSFNQHGEGKSRERHNQTDEDENTNKELERYLIKCKSNQNYIVNLIRGNRIIVQFDVPDVHSSIASKDGSLILEMATESFLRFPPLKVFT